MPVAVEYWVCQHEVWLLTVLECDVDILEKKDQRHFGDQ